MHDYIKREKYNENFNETRGVFESNGTWCI